MVTRLSNAMDSVSLNTSKTEIVVTDLVPYSEYEVMIAALTREGSGPCTDPLILQTEQDGKLLLHTYADMSLLYYSYSSISCPQQSHRAAGLFSFHWS